MKRIIVATLVLMTAACGSSSSAPTTRDEIGTYTLVSVNGNAVPCDFAEGGAAARITAGSLTFAGGGTVHIGTSFTINGQPQSTDVSGTYTRSGNSLTMHYSNGGANTATLSGATLTMMNEGVAWVYARSASS